MRNFQYQLKKELREIFTIPPNDLGIKILTDYYKKLTSYLKTAPFLIVIPLSFLIGVVFYLVFNRLLIAFVNLLQYGF